MVDGVENGRELPNQQNQKGRRSRSSLEAETLPVAPSGRVAPSRRRAQRKGQTYFSPFQPQPQPLPTHSSTLSLFPFLQHGEFQDDDPSLDKADLRLILHLLPLPPFSPLETLLQESSFPSSPSSTRMSPSTTRPTRSTVSGSFSRPGPQSSRADPPPSLPSQFSSWPRLESMDLSLLDRPLKPSP